MSTKDGVKNSQIKPRMLLYTLYDLSPYDIRVLKVKKVKSGHIDFYVPGFPKATSFTHIRYLPKYYFKHRKNAEKERRRLIKEKITKLQNEIASLREKLTGD